MYYIIRHGVDLIVMTREYRSRTLAEKIFQMIQKQYEEKFDSGQINHYTCLLLTRGTRPNEETKSSEHGSGKG